MIEANPAADLIPLLRAATTAQAIPERARQAGAQLLERLTSPIRVAVLGHPRSGKSQLVNLIAGERIIPEGARLPSLSLSYGDTRRMTLVLDDGSEEERDTLTLDKLRRTDIEMIRVEAPLPILKKISLLEVVSRGGAETERENVVWASERADIVLWCSQEFTLAEQWLWAAMPDRLKDHGFLVLTKADLLIREGVLNARIAELGEIVAEEFHSMVPVATIQGLTARKPDGDADDAALTASGARALISAILRHVEQGRRADLDGALMFLSRFGSALPPVEAAAAAVPNPRPAPTAEPARPAPVAQTEARAPAAQSPEAPTPEAQAPTAPAPEAQAPVPAPSDSDTADTEIRASVSQALALIAANVAELGAAADDATAPADPAHILERCVEAANQVVEIIPDDIPAGHPLAQAHDDAMEASEMLLLMQLEKGQGPAADAVTLMLQMRRTLAQSLAA